MCPTLKNCGKLEYTGTRAAFLIPAHRIITLVVIGVTDNESRMRKNVRALVLPQCFVAISPPLGGLRILLHKTFPFSQVLPYLVAQCVVPHRVSLLHYF